MENPMEIQDLKLDSASTNQIQQVINLLCGVLGYDLLGVYLYGSAVFGGLQIYSDIDIFVVSKRATTTEEKSKIAISLLQISGEYMAGKSRPIELTIVEKFKVNPWCYPPEFDFQYGEWLRQEFESGCVDLWPNKAMPDLALLITQVMLASRIIFGAKPKELLCEVPYADIIQATVHGLSNLVSELQSDTRNVLLTLARIWCTVATSTIRTKSGAVDWALVRIPEKHHSVLLRAKAICAGEEPERWDDVQTMIQPCVDLMLNEINIELVNIQSSAKSDKKLALAEFHN